MMSASAFFQALLEPNFQESQHKEVTVPNIDGPTLKAIVNFCYSGKIKITGDNIERLVSAASFMNLMLIEKKCEQFWSNGLSSSNCVQTYLRADAHNLSDLRDTSFHFICEHFMDQQLLEAEYSLLTKILKCDEIPHTENETFSQLVNWIEFDKENRAKFAPDLLDLIRLEKITQPVRLTKRIISRRNNTICGLFI